MVVDPMATGLAIPLKLITATLTSDEDHVTCRVRLRDEPSLKLPVAVKGSVAVTPIPGLLGVTTIEVSVALVVFMVNVPTTPPKIAVTVAAPGATPVTMPWKLTTSLTVAIDKGVHVQVTLLERFWVVPSANLPVATSGTVIPTGTLTGAGVMAIDCSGEDCTTRLAVPFTPLKDA